MEKILQCKKGRTNSDSVVCNNITEADVLQQAAKYAYSVPDVGKLAEEIIEKSGLLSMMNLSKSLAPVRPEIALKNPL